MEMQENEMQKIPSDIMKMITYETFSCFKESGQAKRAMAAYDRKMQEVVAAKKYYSGWYHCWVKHITGRQVMDSYYLRIKDLDRISFRSRESVDTAVYHVIPGKNPDDLKYNLDYINRKEIETLADQSGCIYLFNKCVGRVRRIQCETVRYDIVIRNGTDAIADSALADNYQIGSVTLPDSVTVIGTGALERSRLLEKVTLSQNLKYIKDAAFRFCWRLQNVDLPDGLLYIGADAFRKCHEFTEMIIPDSVTYIGSKAFYKCVNLKSVKLPAHITKISMGVFLHCHQLTEIVIPEDVTVIEKDAFAECRSLEKISLPSGLKRIEDGAFANCRKLRFLEIPDSVEYIGEELFGKIKIKIKIKIKMRPTFVASKDNQYVHRYATDHRIKIIDSLNGKDDS